MKEICEVSRRDGRVVLTIPEQALLEHLARDPMAPRVTNASEFLGAITRMLLTATHTAGDGYYRTALEYLVARAAAEAAFERRGAKWTADK